MKNNENHGVFYNMLTALPICGTPSKFLLDYLQLGIEQYGYFLGLLRGGIVGMIFFVMMLTLAEVIPLMYEIPHYYLQLIYIEPVKAEERAMLVETVPDDTHPQSKHWHDRLKIDLDFLNPGKYLLEEHSKSEESKEGDR